MLGADTLGQLVGEPVLDFVHPDYREIAAERVRQVTTEGNVICPSQEKWLRLDRTPMDVKVAARPILYKGKRAVQLIVRKDDGCKLYRTARQWLSAYRWRHKRQ